MNNHIPRLIPPALPGRPCYYDEAARCNVPVMIVPPDMSCIYIDCPVRKARLRELAHEEFMETGRV